MSFEIKLLSNFYSAYVEEHQGSNYNYNIPESNNYGNYDAKQESYVPRMPTTYFHQQPQSVYGTPEYNGKKNSIETNRPTRIRNEQDCSMMLLKDSRLSCEQTFSQKFSKKIPEEVNVPKLKHFPSHR